jgi:hypothetical protein
MARNMHVAKDPRSLPYPTHITIFVQCSYHRVCYTYLDGVTFDLGSCIILRHDAHTTRF